MKQLFILLTLIGILPNCLYADQEFYYKTNFNRGDVVTVLTIQPAASYTLELFNNSKIHITNNIFFNLETAAFKGSAAVIGLDSAIKAGEYILQIKDRDGSIVNTGSILIHENIFKKENIQLNYANSSLRTDPDPEILSQAVAIHKIYGTSDNKTVSGSELFISPLENGIITSWFGDRRKFIYSDGSKAKSIHTGTDIAAPAGTFIRAGHAGKVVFSGERIITGKSAVIEYMPGVYGVFFHMEKLFVSNGDIVLPHSVVGTLGSSGLATGPHLHWEIRVGGVPVDPYPLLRDGLIDNSLIMSIVSSHTAEYSGRR